MKPKLFAFGILSAVLSILITISAHAEPAGNGTHYYAPVPEIRTAGLCPLRADDGHFIKISAYGNARWRLDYCRRDQIASCEAIGRQPSYTVRQIAVALKLALANAHEAFFATTSVLANMGAAGTVIYAVVTKNPGYLIPATAFAAISYLAIDRGATLELDVIALGQLTHWLEQAGPGACLPTVQGSEGLRNGLNRALEVYEAQLLAAEAHCP